MSSCAALRRSLLLRVTGEAFSLPLFLCCRGPVLSTLTWFVNRSNNASWGVDRVEKDGKVTDGWGY